MLLALLLQSAAPQTAVDAERAFNAMAQANGQWTAFRAFAAPDAVMFVPEPVKAQDWLKDREDPPKAVEWWPVASYVSCEGKLAVNTGGWARPGGSGGYFTTVWRREADGSWKWIYDGGDGLKAPRAHPAEPKVRRASCGGRPAIDMGGCISDDATVGCYAAGDQRLQAHWSRANGYRSFSALIWTGRTWEQVLDNEVSESAP